MRSAYGAAGQMHKNISRQGQKEHICLVHVGKKSDKQSTYSGRYCDVWNVNWMQNVVKCSWSSSSHWTCYARFLSGTVLWMENEEWSEIVIKNVCILFNPTSIKGSSV